jgi:hypothetical protein
MTTLRNRRALSMRRRTGLQCEDYQTAMGRTPRHSQSWSDLSEPRTTETVVDLILFAVVFTVVSIVVLAIFEGAR